MQKEYLGEFEELILTMVGILQDDAYGNAIVNEIKARVGRDVNLSAVHVTLYRLEDKGYVKSGMGGATNARGETQADFYSDQCRPGNAACQERTANAIVEACASAKDRWQLDVRKVYPFGKTRVR